MKKKVAYILGLFLLLKLSSCTNANNVKDENETSVIEEDISKQINVQNFFNTIPSSDEIFQVIQIAKLNYNSEFLNNPVQYKNYSLEKPQALNLGVYAADLAISGAFNQPHESMLFLRCTNHLAKELGISSAFDENVMDRFEANKSNRDSILEIISQAFKKSDKILLENKRGNLSVLMIVGAFIESMYVAGEYALSYQQDTMAYNKIKWLYFKQQESLHYLINLLQKVSDIEDKKILDAFLNINDCMKNAAKNDEAFKKTHQLFTDVRKQIISVY
ncbi:MAG: hypothetical protein N2203_00390 [Bacteroidia bacterium]|nr:hypothetical protein [Bacteroidia bacterium]